MNMTVKEHPSMATAQIKKHRVCNYGTVHHLNHLNEVKYFIENPDRYYIQVYKYVFSFLFQVLHVFYNFGLHINKMTVELAEYNISYLYSQRKKDKYKKRC